MKFFVRSRTWFFALSCLALLAGILPAAFAQGVYPPITDREVAMLHNKMSGQVPDIEALVKSTQEYIDASDIDRQIILNTESEALRETYQRLDIKQPFYAQYTAGISEYKPRFEGYFIYEFDDNFFLTYSYAGKNYAVVTSGIDMYQWIHIPESRTAEIEETLKKDRKIVADITLNPVYADRHGTVKIGDRDYNLIMARVVELRFWDTDGRRVLWSSTDAEQSVFERNSGESFKDF